jgi:serine/threonine protein kinase
MRECMQNRAILSRHIVNLIAYDRREKYCAISLHCISLHELLSTWSITVDMRHNILCYIHSIMHDISTYCNVKHGDLKAGNILCDINEYGCLILVICDWGFAVKYDRGTVQYNDHLVTDINSQIISDNALNPYMRTTPTLVSACAMLTKDNFEFMNANQLLCPFGHICDMYGIVCNIINVYLRRNSTKKRSPVDAISILYKIMMSIYPKVGSAYEQFTKFNKQVDFLCWDINEDNRIIHQDNANSRAYYMKYPNNILKTMYENMNDIFTIDRDKYTADCVSNEHLAQCIIRCAENLKNACTHKMVMMLDNDIYSHLAGHCKSKQKGYLPVDQIIFNGDDLVYTEQYYMLLQ